MARGYEEYVVTLVFGEQAREATERLLRIRMVLEEMEEEMPWRDELKQLQQDASELAGVMIEMRGRNRG